MSFKTSAFLVYLAAALFVVVFVMTASAQAPTPTDDGAQGGEVPKDDEAPDDVVPTATATTRPTSTPWTPPCHPYPHCQHYPTSTPTEVPTATDVPTATPTEVVVRPTATEVEVEPTATEVEVRPTATDDDYDDPEPTATETLPWPPTPSIAAATTRSRTSVRITWSYHRGFSTYSVKYRPTGLTSGGRVVKDDEAPGDTVEGRTISGLLPCTSYQFNLRGRGDGVRYRSVWSGWSGTAYATTDCDPTPTPTEITPDPTATSITPDPTATTEHGVPTPTEEGDPRPPPTETETGGQPPVDPPPVVSTIQPPALTIAVRDSVISVSWSKQTGATDYEVRYSEAGRNAWTERPSSADDSQGQVHMREVSRDTDYEVQIRVASAGENDGATWGNWSLSYFTKTGPPDPPPALSLVYRTDSAIKVSWTRVNGAAHSDIRARPVRWYYRQESEDGPASEDTDVVKNLRPNTEHTVSVRLKGDGVRYTKQWGRWSSDLTVTTLQPYARPVQLTPTDGSGCGWPRARVASDHEILRFPDGSRHTARVEILRRFYSGGNWCLEGMIENKSRPGAETATWGGDFHQGELEVEDLDTSAFGRAVKQYNVDVIAGFFRWPRAGETDAVPVTLPYTCPGPCKGGKIHTSGLRLSPRLFKHHTLQLDGTHEFTAGGTTRETTTSATWESESNVEQDPFNVDNQGVLLLEYLGRVLAEIDDDLTDEQEQEIRTAFDEE